MGPAEDEGMMGPAEDAGGMLGPAEDAGGIMGPAEDAGGMLGPAEDAGGIWGLLRICWRNLGPAEWVVGFCSLLNKL